MIISVCIINAIEVLQMTRDCEDNKNRNIFSLLIIMFDLLEIIEAD